MINLKDLVKYGNLGAVYITMHAERVKELMGKPDFTGGGSNKYQWENIWRYGDLELGFEQGSKELFYIAINFWSEHRNVEQGENLKFDPWVLKGGLGINDFLKSCEKEKIECQELIPPRNVECREFITKGGMHLIFENGKNTEGLTKVLVSEHQYLQ